MMSEEGNAPPGSERREAQEGPPPGDRHGDSAFKGDARIRTLGFLLTHACVIVPVILPRRILLGQGAIPRASGIWGLDVKESLEEGGIAVILI